jgi:hypothetical protein
MIRALFSQQGVFAAMSGDIGIIKFEGINYPGIVNASRIFFVSEIGLATFPISKNIQVYKVS